MTLGQAFIEALESLSGNKLRSGLTVLGIVIGVAAVIAMLAVGNGAQASITGSISGIGTNLLFVFRGARGANSTEIRNPKPLTLSDADAIADPFAAPSVQAVAPALQSNLEVVYGKERPTTDRTPATPNLFTVRKFTLAEGDSLTEEQVLSRASVAVLGPDIADKLFGHQDGVVVERILIVVHQFRG